MIITTRDGQSFDTEKDLEASERHVLQKLFLWETMAASLGEFKEKTDAALRSGWNRSGPIDGSKALMSIIRDLEAKVSKRLESKD
jgi:hypothetical protein